MSNRHKWEQKGHYYHHTFRCIKCGCIKDTRTIGRIIYKGTDGKEYYNAPKCIEKPEEHNV